MERMSRHAGGQGPFVRGSENEHARRGGGIVRDAVHSKSGSADPQIRRLMMSLDLVIRDVGMRGEGRQAQIVRQIVANLLTRSYGNVAICGGQQLSRHEGPEVAAGGIPDADVDASEQLAALDVRVDVGVRRCLVVDHAIVSGFGEDHQQVLAISGLQRRRLKLRDLATRKTVARDRELRQWIAQTIGGDPILLRLGVRELPVDDARTHLLELKLDAVADASMSDAPTFDASGLRAGEERQDLAVHARVSAGFRPGAWTELIVALDTAHLAGFARVGAVGVDLDLAARVAAGILHLLQQHRPFGERGAGAFLEQRVDVAGALRRRRMVSRTMSNPAMPLDTWSAVEPCRWGWYQNVPADDPGEHCTRTGSPRRD